MLTIRADVDATFVAAPVPRDGSLALWGPGVGADAGADLDLVVLDDAGLHRQRVAVRLVPVSACIDVLATLPAAADASPSVRAWSVATNLALDLIARGRLLPSVTVEGVDEWRVGPFDPADQIHLVQLAEALPPRAHALEEPGEGDLRVVAPGAAVGAFLNAVADTLVRTAAAPLAAGHDPFAATEHHDVSAHESWLRSTTGASGAAAAALRLDLPDDLGEPVRCVLEIRSTLDPGLVISAADLWAAPPAVLARFGADVDTALLVTLRRASRVWAPIGRLLAEARPDHLDLDDVEAEELFGPLADDLAAAGLPVLWPAEVLRPLALRSVVTTQRPESITSGGLDLESAGQLRWRATVDGEDLTEEELTALAEAKRPMVRMRGRWVRADPDQLRRLGERRQVRTGEVLAAALSGSLTVEGEAVEAEIEGPLLALVDRLRSFEGQRDGEPPAGLQAELRAYQQRGVEWLEEMASLGLGGVLADDMGLGKTIQVLALHLARRGSGPTLIVCPTTLLGNWEREAARFTPDVPVRRHHGAARSLDDLEADELVVTTYGVVRRDAAALAETAWGLVVADEAQAVKNPFSRTARALRTIRSPARIALTGTPVENRLSDLWALLDWTTPGLLGPLEAFQRTIAVPIEREKDEDATARLAATVRPFLLRRRKSDPDIAPDLPPKTETDRFVGLTVEQSTLYRAVVAELLDDVAEAEGIDRRGLVLKLLTALKQICNHPAQYLGQGGPLPGRSGKLDAAADLVQVIADEGDSVLVFTQYVAMGRLVTAHLDDLGIESRFLHGGTPVRRREEMVDELQAGHPKVLVLSLKAGGTGLNLTRATHVIHYDRWWNPAVEDQASDRTWRIGQDRPVQVHRLISEGTLEERVAVLLQAKRALADAVVGGGEAWVSELSDEELAGLVALGSADG
ncbi:MAG: DEAD/DEAH box helicase [Acidimicrobiales bacterium]